MLRRWGCWGCRGCWGAGGVRGARGAGGVRGARGAWGPAPGPSCLVGSRASRLEFCVLTLPYNFASSLSIMNATPPWTTPHVPVFACLCSPPHPTPPRLTPPPLECPPPLCCSCPPDQVIAECFASPGRSCALPCPGSFSPTQPPGSPAPICTFKVVLRMGQGRLDAVSGRRSTRVGTWPYAVGAD